MEIKPFDILINELVRLLEIEAKWPEDENTYILKEAS